MNDDEAWMAWFIRKYDDTEDPDLRAELLMCHGIHPQVLASERRRLAHRAQSQPTKQTTTPFRTSRATRRPTTPRRAGSPRTYQVKVTRTQRIRTAKGNATVATVTTTVTTVTTINSLIPLCFFS
ncbi:hypothetical protein ABZ137_21175 [Streptomyces bobili]|uniref:hypothetical protein n=1 Tax=Streptomyces bobili TaxID=67280 RepID=UPI0033A181B4